MRGCGPRPDAIGRMPRPTAVSATGEAKWARVTIPPRRRTYCISARIPPFHLRRLCQEELSSFTDRHGQPSRISKISTNEALRFFERRTTCTKDINGPADQKVESRSLRHSRIGVAGPPKPIRCHGRPPGPERALRFPMRRSRPRRQEKNAGPLPSQPGAPSR